MEKCAICGCRIHRKGDDYAKPNSKGRSHATKHHNIAKRFLNGDNPIFPKCPWPEEQKSPKEFCYECHEELLHNPIFLSADISGFAKLVERRNLNETNKTDNRSKIAGRIKLLHEVIEEGIRTLLG